MNTPLRIAHVGPVATTIPAAKNGSVELVTALITDELVKRGHDVTLFATGHTQTTAKLHAVFPRGYLEDAHAMWPWELCELMNLTAACERSSEFDVIHYQGAYYPLSVALSRLVPIPMVHTLHHQPLPMQVEMWRRYADTHYVAISDFQARPLAGFSSVTTIPHGIDTDNFPFGPTPGDHLVFLGRFTPGKGVLEAIEVAKRSGTKLLLAAPECDYYRSVVAPHVDGTLVQYVGELDFAGKTALLCGARALLYPVQQGEPFGLVLAEAMACGTPVAALDKGAVPEVVKQGIGGYSYPTLDALIAGLPDVYALDRARVREYALANLDVRSMVDGYERLYRRLIAQGQTTGGGGGKALSHAVSSAEHEFSATPLAASAPRGERGSAT
jgi:glycosyltransferase involved in cell wall biosynthesis